jgi:hypothetical protein
VALDVLRQVPVLWVWDNIEPIAGFPEGTPSAWSPEEQAELAAFLRAIPQAKLLLTFRRDEQHWLGKLPRAGGVAADADGRAGPTCPRHRDEVATSLSRGYSSRPPASELAQPAILLTT